MTIANHDDAREMLKRVQENNNPFEMNELIKWISKTYERRIFKYLSKNRAVENEDLKQEFMIGIGLSIQKARLDIGDPLEYIVKQGVWRVRGSLRQNVISKTVQQCNECGNISRLNRIGTDYICKKCGSTNIVTSELDDHDEIALQNAEATDLPIEDEIMSVMMIEKFEQTLTEGTNVYNLYMLLKSGVNRDNPQIENYLKTISQIWGGCSEQNVVQALGKLKSRLIKFADDNGMDIVGNQFVIRDGD